jgi:large subunit ribosomal protein L21
MYAIIKTGGKQYRVQEGDVVFIEKLEAEVDSTVNFDVLMVASDDDMKVGSPFLTDASVTGKVLAHGKGAKIVVFKMKSKKNYRKKQGHRQPFTKVEITGIKA